MVRTSKTSKDYEADYGTGTVPSQNDDTDLGTCRTPGKGIVESLAGEKMDQVQQLQLRAKLQVLLQEHADLDAAISALEDSGASDQLQIRRLKKKKLSLKDEITAIENLLIPDIIA
jgi:hypothetical protein